MGIAHKEPERERAREGGRARWREEGWGARETVARGYPTGGIATIPTNARNIWFQGGGGTCVDVAGQVVAAVLTLSPWILRRRG